jgi:Fic family protein
MIHKDIGDAPGEYKKFYNYVKPSSPTTPPQHVKERMRLLLQWYNENKGKLHPFVLASVFHMQFEMIHPFADGNGRVGRLLMNYILEERDFLPLTILEKTKQNYYRSLENKSIQQFLDYVLTSFIEEYRR